MKNIMKIMAIFTIILISFTAVAFAESTVDSKQNIQQIKEKVLSSEKKLKILESVTSKVKIINKIPTVIKQLEVKSVQKNEIHTMENIKLIPASKQVTLKIENGKAYVVKANIAKEIKAEPYVLIAQKISNDELNNAKNFKVKADIQNNELKYNVTYEIPNPIPIINWFFPVITKEVQISAEEIKQANIEITKITAEKITAIAISATPAPVKYK